MSNPPPVGVPEVVESPIAASPAPPATTMENPATPRGLLPVIMAAVFMVSAEARVVAPLLPAIAQDFESTVSNAGLLITAYTIPYGLFQLIYGPLADRFSRQRVIGSALGLFALGTFISGFMPSLVTLDLLRFCTGAAAAGVIPVALAYVGDAVPYHKRQAALGRVVSVASLGGIMSAALGGLIASLLSWRAMFVVYGLVAAVVAIWLLRLPVYRLRAKDRAHPGLVSPYVKLFQLAGRRAPALYVLVFIEGAVATSTVGYLGAFLYERDHLSYAVIGLLLTINGVASIVIAQFVGSIVRRIHERGMILLGGTLLTASYLVVGLRPLPIFFPLGLLLGGAGFVIAHSTLQTRATELVPSMRGTAVALFAFSLFLGGGLGTYLAGLAIDQFHYQATLIGTAAACAAFTVCGWFLLQEVQG